MNAFGKADRPTEKEFVVRPTNDLLFKKVLASEGNGDIALGFVRDLFEDDSIVEVRPLVPYNLSAIKEKFAKNVIDRTEVDFLCSDVRGKRFLFEMQVEKTDIFDWRSLYYLCMNFCSSYDREGKKYEDLVEVRSVNFLGYSMFGDERAFRRFQMRDIKSGEKLFDHTVFEIGFFEFCKPGLSGRLKHVSDFFRFGRVGDGAPEYLKKACGVVKFVNLSEEERNMIQNEETIEERYEGIRKAAVKDARKEYIVSLHENGVSVDDISKLLRESRSFVEDCLRGVK
jgi:hypothetical protein